MSLLKLFRQDRRKAPRHVLQGAGVTFDLLNIAGAQASLHVRDGLRNDRQAFHDGEQAIEDVLGDAGVLHNIRGAVSAGAKAGALA